MLLFLTYYFLFIISLFSSESFLLLPRLFSSIDPFDRRTQIVPFPQHQQISTSFQKPLKTSVGKNDRDKNEELLISSSSGENKKNKFENESVDDDDDIKSNLIKNKSLIENQLGEDLKAVPNDEIFQFDFNRTVVSMLNLAKKKDKLNSMIHTARVNVNKSLDYHPPISEISKSILHGSTLPTLVPGQEAPLPNLKRNVFCNPAINPGGCTSVADVARSVGAPLLSFYKNSNIGRFQNTISAILGRVEEMATAKITPEVVDALELEPFVSFLEREILNLAADKTLLQEGNPYYKLYEKLLEKKFYEPLDKLDPPEEQKLKNKENIERLFNEYACLLADNKLPHCENNSEEKNVIRKKISTDYPIVVGGIKNSQNYYNHIYVYGFEISCMAQGGCTSGSSLSFEAQNFDGYYKYVSTNEFQNPIYLKIYPKVEFSNFPKIKNLYLWIKSDKIQSDQIVDPVQTWAAITPHYPSFEFVKSQNNRPPFAIVYGDNEPKECKSKKIDYPFCSAAQSGLWNLVRVGEAGCDGMRTPKGFCSFPIKLSIIPTTYNLDS